MSCLMPIVTAVLDHKHDMSVFGFDRDLGTYEMRPANTCIGTECIKLY